MENEKEIKEEEINEKASPEENQEEAAQDNKGAQGGEPAPDSAVADAEKKAKDWEDKYLRLYAEFDNFKKRTQREKDARYADAVIDTVNELLTVKDNLERALATPAESEEAKKIREGVSLVYKQMQDVLTKLGVTEIKALGEQFDPNLHNAVMHVEDDAVDDNTVVEEFMKGYMYKDKRVVRHSMVKVAN